MRRSGSRRKRRRRRRRRGGGKEEHTVAGRVGVIGTDDVVRRGNVEGRDAHLGAIALEIAH